MQTLYSKQILLRRKPRAKNQEGFSIKEEKRFIPQGTKECQMLLHFLLSSLDLEPPSYFASWVAQLVKNLPAVQESWIQSPGWEDPLGEGMATRYGILAWRIPINKGTWQATDHKVTKSHTRLSN